ncbi:catalase/peroxidase HPI [Yoonia sp. SS1-5]|uniref:Catalase-peroxidase n=1 Tax=Yoonia rhodophyticola TaxID=3137370 RepID=A0AAN0NGU4_9RHOB
MNQSRPIDRNQQNIPTSCPFGHTQRGTANNDWWPNRLNLGLLHQHSQESIPLQPSFNYSNAFEELDYAGLKADLIALMTDSQEWWPADYGHYGPFLLRMAWHSAGTYRTADGRGGGGTGNQRFAPLNSWPDNGNLDKARLLLWPIKRKYGKAISWADLIILAGNCALESMGFETLGFAGGRQDIWEPEIDVYWGKEKSWLGNERYSGERVLEQPLAAVQMGLIYVNPEGPDGKPDPAASAHDIRETFARMGMNDEETVALVAGGHTFGKCHGAASDDHLGPAPEGAPIEMQAKGWASTFGSGKGIDAITTGIEGAWTPAPTQWDMGFFDVLMGYDWDVARGPGGAWQWYAVGLSEADHAPKADGSGMAPIMMTTADMAMKIDPAYAAISRRFHNSPDAFSNAFAQAWFKLTHRDMGPSSRYLGHDKPNQQMIWQDPLPPIDHPLIDADDVDELKSVLLDCGLAIADLVWIAWASASTFRCSDFRGGANGARIALSPQKDWEVNEPSRLENVIEALTFVQMTFNSTSAMGKKVSLADLIVLAGCAGIEAAAHEAGYHVEVPFVPGRSDATDGQTDFNNMEVLKNPADGFRNYEGGPFVMSSEELLIDKAQLLGLSAPEMTALVGGLRVLGANFEQKEYGVFTDRPGVLSSDFFINLLDLTTTWRAMEGTDSLFVGHDNETGAVKWIGSRVDLIFGSNTQLRAIAEVYASSDGEKHFINDFVDAWHKVMMADRFDLS